MIKIRKKSAVLDIAKRARRIAFFTPAQVNSIVNLQRVNISTIVPEIGWTVSGLLNTTVATINMTAPATAGTGMYFYLSMGCWYTRSPVDPTLEQRVTLTIPFVTAIGSQSWSMEPSLYDFRRSVDIRLNWRDAYTLSQSKSYTINIMISNNANTVFYPSVWFLHYHVIA